MAERTYTTPLGRNITPTRASPVKRAFDFTVALIGLIVISPVLVIVAVLVKLTSRGPVFYRDDRFGLGGTTHKMLKFRSMKVGAPPAITSDGKLIVTKRDPRLTPVGRYLRALHLDEIPQLINVLKGDMSLVGPRSGQPAYEGQYDDLAYERLRVRPGVTGLGAVVGGRHLTNESLYAVEARYVQRQCLWLDLLIILATPVYIFLGAAASRGLLRRYLDGLELRELGDTSET